VVSDEPDVKAEVAAIEAICKSNLRNPHIINIYDILFRDDLWGRQAFIQMEFCDGTLDSYLDEMRSLDSEIQPLELAEIMIQVLTGLCHCHTLGFCHRDLKLANSTQLSRFR
jgi:serine/threonine protein kinase